MNEFYILSLKYSRHDEDSLTWWRPDRSGYTSRLEAAGRYSEAEVRQAPGYFDNRESTLAIPCEVVEKFAVHVVLSAAARAMLTEVLGRPVGLVGTTLDDKDYEGREECPRCGRGYGQPGPSRLSKPEDEIAP